MYLGYTNDLSLSFQERRGVLEETKRLSLSHEQQLQMRHISNEPITTVFYRKCDSPDMIHLII